MGKLLRRLKAWRDERGVAAIEFALVVPVLTGLVLFGVDGWMRINQVTQMRSAVQSAERYYQAGGSDDTAAAQLALQSWSNAPGDATVQANRTCSCAGVGASCNSQCAGASLPNAYVTLTATGTFSGMMTQSQSLTESGVIRVR